MTQRVTLTLTGLLLTAHCISSALFAIMACSFWEVYLEKLAFVIEFYLARNSPSLLRIPALYSSVLLLSSYAILNFVRKISFFTMIFLFTLALVSMITPGPVLAGPDLQATIVKSIFIQNPREGQALQGVEIIDGKIRGEGFLTGSIHFSYSETTTQQRTWFYLAELEGDTQDSSQTAFQVEWDTTQITDGDYDLRVIAEYSGGAAIFEVVTGLRIRNYSPIETPTPGLSAEGNGVETPLPVPDTIEPKNTATQLPPNPVEVQSRDLERALLISGFVVAGIFFVGIIYWYLSSRDR